MAEPNKPMPPKTDAPKHAGHEHSEHDKNGEHTSQPGSAPQKPTAPAPVKKTSSGSGCCG